jgi:2-C-methyl-D-erythritol 4-phosphate cytidylyltransferase
MIGTIVLAAGKGARFGNMKQFLKYDKLSPFDVVYEKFRQVSDFIVAVVPEDYVAEGKNYVQGGYLRLDSIMNGYKWLMDQPVVPGTIVIAEAARPFIEMETIGAMLEQSKQHEVAVVWSPSPHVVMANVSHYNGYYYDTEVYVHQPRDRIRLIEPPSAWDYRILGDLLENLKPRWASSQVPAAFAPLVSDDIAWVNAKGRNPKLTYKHEFAMFEAYVRSEECQRILKSASPMAVESAQ